MASCTDRPVRIYECTMFFRNTLSPYFDPFTYLQLNEDVRLSGVDPVQHFLKFGRKEGRRSRLEGQGDVSGFLSKVQLCGLLSAKFDLKKYLEITTTTTGNQYADTAVFGFTDRKRLVYRHAGTISDGLPIDYSSANDDISECLQKLKQSKAKPPLISSWWTRTTLMILHTASSAKPLHFSNRAGPWWFTIADRPMRPWQHQSSYRAPGAA